MGRARATSRFVAGHSRTSGEGEKEQTERDDRQMIDSDDPSPEYRARKNLSRFAAMIRTSHFMTMKDRVGVAELKARLSEYLRRVRRGETVTVLDRDTEIARIVPLADADLLSVRGPAGGVDRIGEVPLPPPLDLEVDVLDLLREERQAER